MTDHQRTLVELLERHPAADPTEARHRAELIRFVREREDCFDRRALPGHVTGSAFVVDLQHRKLLLHHHRKLDRWLQMGGHDDGERNAALTALREAREESGLSELTLGLEGEVLDVDVHSIPARGAEPSHLHLDVRFLVTARSDQALRRDAAESLDLAWFSYPEARIKMSEPGGHRAIDRLERLP